jgi:hypothetical protein
MSMPRKKNKRDKDQTGKHQSKLPGEISSMQKQRNEDAHRQAERDIMNDAEFSAHSPNDDLDEGETARLGEDHTDLV